MVDWLAPQLLGRHVGDRADYSAASGYGGQFLDGAPGIFWRRLQLCHSEVENLHPAIGGHEQVFWLQVAMNDAAIVRRDQPLHDLQSVVEGEGDGQCSIRQPFAQGVAFEQFANDVRSAIVEANVINGDDVGMIQRRCGAGFQFETAEMIRIVAGGGADQLQSDIAPQPFVARAKNLAHGSGANFLEDSVVTYDLASHVLGQPCWHVRGACPLPSITRSGHCTCPMGNHSASRLQRKATAAGIASCYNSVSPAYFRGSL